MTEYATPLVIDRLVIDGGILDDREPLAAGGRATASVRLGLDEAGRPQLVLELDAPRPTDDEALPEYAPASTVARSGLLRLRARVGATRAVPEAGTETRARASRGRVVRTAIAALVVVGAAAGLAATVVRSERATGGPARPSATPEVRTEPTVLPDVDRAEATGATSASTSSTVPVSCAWSPDADLVATGGTSEAPTRTSGTNVEVLYRLTCSDQTSYAYWVPIATS
jgi:hypothetical protein